MKNGTSFPRPCLVRNLWLVTTLKRCSARSLRLLGGLKIYLRHWQDQEKSKYPDGHDLRSGPSSEVKHRQTGSDCRPTRPSPHASCETGPDAAWPGSKR